MPDPRVPFELRSIDFSVNVTSAARLVVEFHVWDAYDTATSPVNTGLLRTEEHDYGTLQANLQGEFSERTFPFSTPIPLWDPDVFLEFTFKSDFGAVPPNRAFRPIADGSPGGPLLGASENDVYTDQDANGAFTFSAPNAGDRRVIDNRTACGPENCQTNWLLHVRGARDPELIDPGMDLWQTPGGGTTFSSDVLFQGFFDSDDQGNFCVPGGFNSSDEYDAGIVFAGLPLDTDPPGELGATDTIVLRKAEADLRSSDSVTVPIQILALSLQGTITVTYDGGQSPTLWSVRTCLSDLPQSAGTMTIAKGSCLGEGRTFTSVLPVIPKLIFTQISPAPVAGCTGVITFDYGPSGLSVVLGTQNGHCLPDAPPFLGLTEELIPGLQTDANCDGIGDDSPFPATTNFHPGVRFPRCPGAACDPRAPIERLTREQAQLAAHGVLPAEQPEPDTDGDGIPDAADNCPSLPNPLQEDAADDALGDPCDGCPFACNPEQADPDGDGVQEACDNCPNVPNANQANADGDAFGDACDCAPLDPTNPVPAEVLGLRYSQPIPDKETLAWQGQPSATLYQLVRGALSALPVGPGGGDEVCLAHSSQTTFADLTRPAAGGGFFYLVRGENGCGAADYGRWGSGAHPTTARVTSTCP